MKVRAPSANSRYFEVKSLMREGGLVTICEEARCPNIGECWGRGTATFQILGDTCTRACRYCYVHSGKPDGPARSARAAPARAGGRADEALARRRHLGRPRRPPDRGAGHYAATIRAIKRKLPAAKVEILTPDFLDVEEEALATVLAARPEVFNHNIETVRRLHARMRGAKASYDKALWLLERAKEVADYPCSRSRGSSSASARRTTRSSRRCATSARTASTSSRSASTCSRRRSTRQIDRWVHPDEFRWFREQGEALGFGSVFSGPLVRSSYRADEQRHAAETGRGAVVLATPLLPRRPNPNPA